MMMMITNILASEKHTAVNGRFPARARTPQAWSTCISDTSQDEDRGIEGHDVATKSKVSIV
jgi:hypothetical protein